MIGALGGARCGSRSQPPPFGSGSGGTSELDARPQDPGQGQAWDRLEQARAEDPAGADVRAIAEELLAGELPLPTRLAALRAKAEHAYLHQEDPLAIATAEEGLALVSSAPDDSRVLVDLARIRVRAMCRGGDPATALAALEDEPLIKLDELSLEEVMGLRAVALDRNADRTQALMAFARWREVLPQTEPTALWAEHRLALLADDLPPAAVAAVVEAMPASAARACLAARLGEPVASGMPDWVARCGGSSPGIGMLLPRSGPFAAFADEQLAAALATVEVVSAEGPVPPLVWRDSGSTTKSARSAAKALMADGARVMVGPVGAKNVKAVTQQVDGQAALYVPGEGRGAAKGVAPRLEDRVAALIEVARAQGSDRLVVLAPDNSYGKRAAKAVETQGTGFEKPLVTRFYPPTTTTFSPHVNPVMTALRGKAALLVPDSLSRTELVVRQVARAGRVPAHDDVPGVLVLTTAEGISAQTLSRARDVLEGVFIAPAAARGPQIEPFVSAFTAMQGEAPGDQALLLFYALQHAILGRPGPGAGVTTVTRVAGGRLVVQTASDSG